MDALLTKTKAATEPEEREQSKQKISGSEDRTSMSGRRRCRQNFRISRWCDHAGL